MEIHKNSKKFAGNWFYNPENLEINKRGNWEVVCFYSRTLKGCKCDAALVDNLGPALERIVDESSLE